MYMCVCTSVHTHIQKEEYNFCEDANIQIHLNTICFYSGHHFVLDSSLQRHVYEPHAAHPLLLLFLPCLSGSLRSSGFKARSGPRQYVMAPAFSGAGIEVRVSKAEPFEHCRRLSRNSWCSKRALRPRSPATGSQNASLNQPERCLQAPEVLF